MVVCIRGHGLCRNAYCRLRGNVRARERSSTRAFRVSATPASATVDAMRNPLMFLLAATLAGCATVPGDTAMGTKPSYLQTVSTDMPNGAALRHRIFTPSLDETFVPQGLTSAGNFLFVSSYKPTPDLKSNTGPCRV